MNSPKGGTLPLFRLPILFREDDEDSDDDRERELVEPRPPRSSSRLRAGMSASSTPANISFIPCFSLLPAKRCARPKNAVNERKGHENNGCSQSNPARRGEEPPSKGRGGPQPQTKQREGFVSLPKKNKYFFVDIALPPLQIGFAPPYLIPHQVPYPLACLPHVRASSSSRKGGVRSSYPTQGGGWRARCDRGTVSTLSERKRVKPK